MEITPIQRLLSVSVWVRGLWFTCPTVIPPRRLRRHHRYYTAVCVGAASYLAVDMDAACDSAHAETHLQRNASSWQLQSQNLALPNIPSVLFETYEHVKCVQLCLFSALTLSLYVFFFFSSFHVSTPLHTQSSWYGIYPKPRVPKMSFSDVLSQQIILSNHFCTLSLTLPSFTLYDMQDLVRVSI